MQVLNMGKWYITNNNNMSIIIIQHISMNTWIYIADTRQNLFERRCGRPDRSGHPIYVEAPKTNVNNYNVPYIQTIQWTL